MPPLIAAALLGAGFYAGLRELQRVSAHMAAEALRAADKARAAAAGPGAAGELGVKDLGALEFDPIAGVYKPSSGPAQ